MNTTIQTGLLAVGVLVVTVILLVIVIVMAIPIMALLITFALWRPNDAKIGTKCIVRYDRRKMPQM